MVESYYCSSQYKSYANFGSLRRLCDLLNCRMICVFAISEHGNGKGDHIGGKVETAVAIVKGAESFFKA